MNQYLYINVSRLRQVACLCLLMVLPTFTFAQEVLAPPSLGQETKGTPAIIDEVPSEQLQPVESLSETSENEEETNFGLLGRTEIDEQRRENGQVYRIELKHSSGSTQYIEENDSDGELQSTDNDIEETPNLAKWRIGSW